MFGMGTGELLLVFFVILLVFGAKNIPEIAKSLGKAVKDFRNAANEIKYSVESAARLEEKAQDSEGQKKQ